MESQPLSVVVLAAGLGKRMQSRQPKVLHRLAGLPLAAHVLRALAPLSPTHTVLVVGHGAEQVEDTIGNSYGLDGSLPITYARQPEQLGTGHAVLMAREALRGYHGPVLVLYGDTPLIRTDTLNQLLSRHRQSRPHVTMLSSIVQDPTGYGRVARDKDQNVLAVVEERNANMVQRAINEINSGVYVFESDWLWTSLHSLGPNQVNGEYYLTDLIGMAIKEERGTGTTSSLAVGARGKRRLLTFTLDGIEETMGINSRAQLAEAEAIVQGRLRRQWLEAGVTMFAPDTVYLGMDVHLDPDTMLYPGVILEGATRIATGCVLGPNTHIISSTVGENCRIVASMLEGSTVERDVSIGPYSHLRQGAHLMQGVRMGNFGEVVRSTLEPNVNMNHFSYVGDATIGEGTNIGAGTITANYDGVKKNRTTVGKNVFLGSDTMLRAPIEVGDGAITGLGSVVTKDVQPHTMVVGVPARMIRRLEAPKAAEDDETGEAGEEPEQEG
ncbi:MAG TPA: bifunctional UDP-N-acetylglucosamine diphosphorylase/glucosamine-1-phosphate N-acetyltransferase GlmU [Chloroflexia bacterium]|jgi:bifunctional UDP-N-acetylglucosamine pyrophosphorylase/glucosamine-1-phosphate N-acetyltransferase